MWSFPSASGIFCELSFPQLVRFMIFKHGVCYRNSVFSLTSRIPQPQNSKGEHLVGDSASRLVFQKGDGQHTAVQPQPWPPLWPFCRPDVTSSVCSEPPPPWCWAAEARPLPLCVSLAGSASGSLAKCGKQTGVSWRSREPLHCDPIWP